MCAVSLFAAQATKGELAGLVRDPAGLPVKDAAVRVDLSETGFSA